jgi:hypothetical protein
MHMLTCKKEKHTQGDFVRGQKHGLGKMTYNDGTVEEGRWNEDVFHKR